MEYCLAAAALNGVDRRSLQRSARLGREVLERAKRRAVDWHSPERSRGSVGVLYRQGPYQERWSVPGSQRLLGEPRLAWNSCLRFREKKGSQPSALPSEPWLNSWTILQVSVGNTTPLRQRKEGQPTSTVITEGSLRKCMRTQTLGTVKNKETAEERHLLVQEASTKPQSILRSYPGLLRTSLRTST
ncbi:A-kinase-interacting protein 1 isoform X3 [Apodemus sylvaticus]|uniref:A-kinase-interacting protein 1 isoform X3 n=1 Tax=Apodemus sylvaticus TaxID=10129 RepID=UPI002241A64A|nr:A-kinase-interacting protein 1 isoform X3 [Apodemus sylvaticus]